MTHRESDKRMTKEREAEIRTPCIGYEPQEHVKELLAELDAVRNAAGAIAIDNRFEIVDLRKERDALKAEIDEARRINDHLLKVNTQQAEVIRYNKWDELLAELDALKAERDELLKLNSNGCDLLAKAYEERDKLKKMIAESESSRVRLRACLWGYVGADDDPESSPTMHAAIQALKNESKTPNRVMEVLKQVEKDLIFISCKGMDDADFFVEENITQGTIAMANRARVSLALLRKILKGEER